MCKSTENQVFRNHYIARVIMCLVIVTTRQSRYNSLENRSLE